MTGSGRWEPEDGYWAPEGVPIKEIRQFERVNKKDWQEWFDDYYPGYKVDDLRVLGMRLVSENRPDSKVIEWGIVVESPGGEIKRWSHGEGDDGHGPATDRELFDEMEAMHDFGPVNELLSMDMAEEFGVDPVERKHG